jgi:hypothetical protein
MFKKLFGDDAKAPAGERDPSAAVLRHGALAWIDTCLAGMPDVKRIRDNLVAGGFRQEPDSTAREAGKMLAYEANIINEELRDLHHTLWTGEREGVPVALMLSLAQTDRGPIVLVATLFGAATEADGAGIIVRLANKAPDVGAVAKAPDGRMIRRQFWQITNVIGVNGLIVAGPEDPEALDQVRALIAFNRAV